MHPLTGVWAKLDWGDRGVRKYDRRERQIMGRKEPPMPRLRVEIDREDRACVLYISKVDELPLDLGLIVADVVHSFRSALDQLIFELAFMDSDGREMEKTGFPASDTPGNYAGSHVQNVLLGGLTKTHKAMLKRCQPYRSQSPSTPHPLRLLHDLSNDDKHRLTQPTLMCAAGIQLSFPPGAMTDCLLDTTREIAVTNVVGRPFEPDTEFFRIPLVFTGPEPKVKAKGSATTFVGFRNGLASGDVLAKVGSYARETVQFFAPEFERPKALRQHELPRRGRLGDLVQRGSYDFELVIGGNPPEWAP